MSLEGKVQVPTDIIPSNNNPKAFVSDVQYIKGAPQVFSSIEELVAFHPARMKRGMSVTVTNWPTAGTSSTFILSADPLSMLSGTNSVVTEDNFDQFWELQIQVTSSSTRVKQYAADGLNGAPPTFPYTVGTESEWSNTYDPSKGHKWLRFRDDDVDSQAPIGVYDNWTEPIPILNAFQSGDYVDKRFKREGLPGDFNSTFNSIGGLVAGNYYIIESDDIQITGDLTLADIGSTSTSGSVVLNIGRIFKYVNDPGITYNFTYGTGTGVVRKTIKVPPRTITGLPNNDPAGWSDTPPIGTDQLWEISAQKNVYGQLKSDWLLKKIVEDPSLTRYSNSPSPHPDTLCSTVENANTGSSADLRLEAAGWTAAYAEQVFIARRQSLGGGTYSNWLVEKIAEESGEYVDRMFKLFDLNLDIDDPSIVAPVDRDPTREGWSDSPLAETATQINYVTEARKFIDGTLKSIWSPPVPFTGKPIFNDVITASPTDDFKKDINDVTTPSEIKLTAKLYKGVEQIWETFGVEIEYRWYKVYDGGVAVPSPVQITSTNNADDMYLETPAYSGVADAGGSSTVINDAAGDFIDKGVQPGDKIWNVTDGSYALVTVVNSATQLTTEALQGGGDNTWSSGDNYFLQVDNYRRAGQILVIKPGAVDGQASFRCEQLLTISLGNVIEFADEISVLDITDGRDAQSLSLRADARVIVYDTVNLVFAPANIEFTAYTSNINSPIFYFYRKDGGSWTKLFPAPPTGYTANGSSLLISLATSGLFGANANAQEKTFAVALEDTTDPTTAEFYDVVTIGKLGSSNVGSPGENAYISILSNEAQAVVLDNTTGLPMTGEVTKAKSRISVYFGETKLNYNVSDFVAVVDNTTQFEITNPADGSGDAIVSLKNGTWVNGVRSYLATVTITAGTTVMTKTFSLSSTMDAPGATILDLDSDGGLEFSPTDKTTPKVLTAKLYVNNALIPTNTSPYKYRWKVGNAAATAWSATDNTKTVTRADITSNGVVKVEVSTDNGATILRTRTVIISDVQDGKAYRAWTDSETIGSSLLTNQNPITGFIAGYEQVGSVQWRLQTHPWWDTHTPIWVQDAFEDFSQNPPVWAWTAPYRITGEKGDQGDNGNFIFTMYKATYYEKTEQTTIVGFAAVAPGYLNKGSIVQLKAGEIYYYNGGGVNLVGSYTTTEVKPDFGGGNSSTATLTQMKGGGTNFVDWFATVPSTGIVWKTDRLFKGGDVTMNAGYPEYSPAPTSPFNSDGSVIGSSWASPVRLSATDGRSLSGSNGVNGASPILSVVDGDTAGEKVLRIDGWIGNTPSPSYIGQYLGASGYTPTIGLAQPVTGMPVELRYDNTSKYVQWKYTNESEGSWRNLYLAPTPEFISTATTWTPLTGNVIVTLNSPIESNYYEISAVPYRRRIVVRWEDDEVGGNGGTDSARLSIIMSLNLGTYNEIGGMFTEFTFTGGSSFHRYQVFGDGEIPANNTARIRAKINNIAGGEYVFRWYLGPLFNGRFKIQLIPY